MHDLTIALDHPHALAEMGEILGRSGNSIEGGGMWSGVGHFLVADGEAARRALEDAGMRVLRVSEVVTLRLRQDEPGQLGKMARRMADANVKIDVQYSDHDGRLILVVDDVERGRRVASEWT